MICTEKERDTCQVEKLGCNGCYYNKPRGEEIKNDLVALSFTHPIFATMINNTLLYIDYLEQENAELKTQRDYYKREYSLYNKTLEEAGKVLTKRGE